MLDELSFVIALLSKWRPKVNIRIISLALHRVIAIGILSTLILYLDCYLWTN
jgi:type III secretory pathway component EscT